MKVIKEFSDEECKWIENHVNPDDIRNYFQKNNKKFHKLKAGFRVESLSDDDAILLVSKNLDKGEIEQYIYNALFVPEIDLFERKYEDAKNNGASDTAAIIVGISQTKFKDCPDIFYKLCDKEINNDIQNLISQIHPYLAGSNECEKDYKNRLNNKIKEIEKKQSEIEEKRKNIDTLSEKVKSLEAYKREQNIVIENVKDKLSIAENKLKEMQEEQSKFIERKNELEISEQKEKRKKIERFADFPSTPSVSYEYDRFSLVCRYIFYGDDKITYIRLADININENNVKEFRSIHNNGMFEQRKKILSNDLPDKEKNYYFVVNWRTVAHNRKPGFDWVDAVETKIEPIEIIILSDCYNLDDVKQRLKDGIQLERSSLKWFITYNVEEKNDKRNGILIRVKNLEFADGTAKLKKDILQLPVFNLNIKESFTVGCYEIRKLICDKLYLGMPCGVVTMLNDKEIVKSVIMNYLTKKTFTDRGYSKKDWQEIQKVIEEASNMNIYTRIEQLCNCTDYDAQSMVTAFFDYAENYIDYKDIDSNVIIKMFENNSNLWGNIIKDIRDEWVKSSENELNEWKHKKEHIIQDALKEQENQLNIKKEEYNNILKLYNEKNEQINAIDAKLGEVNRIEEKVREKMDLIKEDSSSFIRDMFLSRPFWQTYFKQTNVDESKNDKELYHTETIQYQELEENDCIDDKEIFDEFMYNLEQFGVSEEYSGALAAMLYTCFEKKVSIILAGSMGPEIASMLGMAIDGKLPPVINMPQSYNGDIINSLSRRTESVLVLNNVLTSEWVTHIDSLLRIPDKYIVFTLPFYDDLQIIPKGVLFYCLPVITDVLLDNECKRCLSQSIKSKNFDKTLLKTIRPYRMAKIMNLMNASTREQKRYANILNCSHIIRFSWGDLIDDIDLDSKVCKKADFIIMALPYCYMKDRAHILLEKELDRENSEFEKEELKKIFWTIGVSADE